MSERKQLPAWIKRGMKCDYHTLIGGPVTIADCTITSEPFTLNEIDNYTVFLDKLNFCVSIKSITPVREKENGADNAQKSDS